MPNVDPTIEFVPIEIEGKTYQMCFDIKSLADAEAKLNANGIEVDLLRGALDLKALKLNTAITMFACSLRRAHPELSYEDACALVNMKNLRRVIGALCSAWLASLGLAEDGTEKNAEATETESS